MAIYKQQTDSRGVIRYKKDGKFTKAAEVPSEVKNVLLAADDGLEVDETGAPVGAEDPASSQYDVDDESGLDEELTKLVPQPTVGGMGYPVNAEGKTVCIFDGTPHTELRYVAGQTVPLSKESYEKRTDAEIVEKLKKLGKI